MISSIIDLHHQSYLNKDELFKLYDSYKKGLLEKTPKEKLIINPCVAYHVSDAKIKETFPLQLVKAYKSVYGDVSDLSKQDPVSNLEWDYLYFVDSDVFRPAAIAFEKSLKAVAGTRIPPSYTQHVKGTKSYDQFWETEFERIVNGYEPIVDGKPCGLKISGEFYFYLNYSIIVKEEFLENGKQITKKTFPNFLAMDYYYFKELDARENPHKYNFDNEFKRSICLSKSRRKGFSFKAAAGAVWITAFNSNARVGIASEPNTNGETDAVKCARKCIPIIDHLSKYTPFGRKEVGNPKNNGGWITMKAKNTDNFLSFTFGIENTKTREQRGRLSTIFTMSLSKDDAASGEGLDRLYFEEAGKIYNLDKAWIFARESMKAGSLFRGISVIFGCVTGNTKIWKANGELVPIKNIKANDNVCGYNGLNYTKENVHYRQEPKYKECYRITTNNDTVLECTYDHPILWSNSTYKYSDRTTINNKRIVNKVYKKTAFQEAQFIKKGDHLAVIDKVDIFGKINMWNPRLIGLLIGDGSYGINKTPVLSNCNSNINKYINDNFDCVIEREYLTSNNNIYKETRIRGITKELRKLNIYGQTNGKKTLPKNIHIYNKNSLSELISGLFDADGYVSFNIDKEGYINGNISLSSAYKSLLQEVKDVLIKFGIHCTINTIKNSKRNRSISDKNDHYRLSISDIISIKRFYRNMELMCDNKQYNLTKLAFSKKKSKCCINNNIVIVHKKGGRHKAKLEHLRNIRFETVKSIENIGLQEIYNLGVGVTHTYLANHIITHNTGGEMKSESGKAGSSKAFSKIFTNPIAAEVAAYNNIYEYKKTNTKCGYFVCDMWANFGSEIKLNGKTYTGLDKQGNAHFWVAEMKLNKERAEKVPPNDTQKAYNKFLTQRCKTPSEAFLVTSSDTFNSADLISRLNKVRMEPGGFSKFRTPGKLIEYSNGNIVFEPDDTLNPIINMNYDVNNREGCLLMYEKPLTIDNNIPEGAYIISVDPIANNNSGGKSLNAVIVFKTGKYSHKLGQEQIVATYYGRPDIRPLDYLYKLLIKLSKYYNAKITFENDRDGGILKHFTYTGNLHRLMSSPLMVTKKYLPTSKTALREFGHSMGNDKLKSIGEAYLNEWLDFRHPSKNVLNISKNEVVKVEGKRNLDFLFDEMIIDELVNYNRQGNFDAVMAMFGIMIQLEDKYAMNGGLLYDDSYMSKMDKNMISYINNKMEY
jgi:hypothetical protein